MIRASASEAGIYEVVVPFDYLLDPGDRAILRKGQRHILFVTRRPTGGAVPLYDWCPEYAGSYFRKISDTIDEEGFKAYADGRALHYQKYRRKLGFDLTRADLRLRETHEKVFDRVVVIVRDLHPLLTKNVISHFVDPGFIPRFGAGTKKRWDRINKIGAFVYARLVEAEDRGLLVSEGDHPPYRRWKPNSRGEL